VEPLTLNRVDSLVKIVPSARELDIVLKYTGEAPLEEAAQYFVAVANLPRLEARLGVLRMVLSLEPDMEAILTRLCLLRAVCEQLVASTRLSKVLEILLGMANTINTRKTSGFRMSSLMNLAKTTSPNNPRITLLHYLAGVLQKKDDDLYYFEEDLSLLHTASKVDLNSVKAEFSQLRHRVNASQKEVELCAAETEVQSAMGTDAPEDNFGKDMYEACVLGAPSEFQDLADVMTETQDLVSATAAFFGERPDGVQEMLQVLNMFVEEFRRVKSEMESRRGMTDELKV